MDHKGHRKRPAGGKSTLTDRTSGPVPGLGPIRCCIRQWKYLLLQKQRGICGIRVHSSVCACWEKGTESQVGLQIEGFFAIILPNRGEHPGVCPPSSWHRVPGEGCLLNTTVTHRKQWLGCLALLLAIGGLLFFGSWKESNTPAFARMTQQTLVIDPGHGGEDGGAVSPDGVPESGINLQIVRKAEGLLVFLGRSVRLTRTGEEAIYSPEAQTLREKKVSDLKNRVALINDLPHAVLLSIHQNSMPQHPAVHGAQVFSNPQEPAAGLAQSIQQALNLTVNTGNEKTAKAIGDSVYLMKHITCPGVLVECGFLSNSDEAQLLRQPEQQKRLAAAIVAGYLNFGNH